MQFTEARRQLAGAAELPAVLAAALSSFDAMLAEIHQQEDKAGPGFAAFVLAGASAASGWHAVATAPALADAGHWEHQPPLPAPPVQPSRLGEPEASAELAGVAMILAGHLEQAAAHATSPGDRSACQDGARHAATVGTLLGGTTQS